MKIYADALEEWDDRIGDNWEPPEDLMLDPVEWIKDNARHILTRQQISITF